MKEKLTLFIALSFVIGLTVYKTSIENNTNDETPALTLNAPEDTSATSDTQNEVNLEFQVEAELTPAEESILIQEVVDQQSYTIKSNDNLSSIAEAHDMTIQNILDLNVGIQDPDHIYAGDVINLSIVSDVNSIAEEKENNQSGTDEDESDLVNNK